MKIMKKCELQKLIKEELEEMFPSQYNPAAGKKPFHPHVEVVEGVTVDKSPYVNTWGKSPRGSGTWVFAIDGKKMTFEGNFGVASQKALKQAKAVGATSMKIMG